MKAGVDLNSLADYAVIIAFVWGLVELADSLRRKWNKRKADEEREEIREIVGQVRTNGGSTLLDKVNKTSTDVTTLTKLARKVLKRLEQLERRFDEHLAELETEDED